MEQENGTEIAPGVRQVGEAELEIPANALVACPLVGFRLRSPQDCGACPFCLGVQDRFPGSDKPFEQRYLIACRGEVKSRPVMMRIGD